jgi:hypothetical protein
MHGYWLCLLRLSFIWSVHNLNMLKDFLILFCTFLLAGIACSTNTDFPIVINTWPFKDATIAGMLSVRTLICQYFIYQSNIHGDSVAHLGMIVSRINEIEIEIECGDGRAVTRKSFRARCTPRDPVPVVRADLNCLSLSYKSSVWLIKMKYTIHVFLRVQDYSIVLTSGFLKSKSDVVVPGQPGSLILLAHQKYWLPITNRSLMNRQLMCGRYLSAAVRHVSRAPGQPISETLDLPWKPLVQNILAS